MQSQKEVSTGIPIYINIIMAKKKDKSTDKMMDDFLKMMSEYAKDLTPENQQKIDDILTGKTDVDDTINEMFYRYERPDYSKLGTREITWLGPFFNAEPDDNRVSLCGWVKDESERLPLEQKRDDLRKYFYTLFDTFDKNEKYDEWKFYGPLWMMEYLKLNDCLDVVLEALRQDAHFFSAFIELSYPYMTAVLRQLGSGQMDVLKDFLYEKGLVPASKVPVFDAIVSIAIHEPAQRLAALSTISAYLSHCYDICIQGADASNIDHYANTLATAHIKEMLPILEKLYHDVEIPPLEFSDGIKDVKEIMDDEDVPFRFEHDSLNDYLMDLYGDPTTKPYRDMPYGHFFTEAEMKELDKKAEKVRKEFKENDDFDDDYLNSLYPPALDSDEPQQCYTVKVALEEAPVPVSRTFTVPSNIYLREFAELIMTAFGRKDLPHFHFECQKEYYTPEDSNPVIDPEHDADLITLQHLLKKEGQQIGFTLLGGSKLDVYFWEHNIVLKEISEYEDPEGYYLVDLEGAEGAYPPKACKNMKEYEKRLRTGKIRRINDMTIADNLNRWEDENL